MTERERQATTPIAFDWIVYPHPDFADAVAPVMCRAPSESGAFRVAEAEYPGVHFVSAKPSDPIHFAPGSDDDGICDSKGYLTKQRASVTCARCHDRMRV